MLRSATPYGSCRLRRGIARCRSWAVSSDHGELSIPRGHLNWLDEQGWAVICVRSVFAGQASLATGFICPAKQINFRLCVSDCCDLLEQPPCQSLQISRKICHVWWAGKTQMRSASPASVTQSTKDLRNLFFPPLVNRGPEPRWKKKIPAYCS